MHVMIWAHYELHMMHKLKRQRNPTSNYFGGPTKCHTEVRWFCALTFLSCIITLSHVLPFKSTGAFRPAWSFKHFMYLLGVTSHPDETAYDCGEHLALSNEPNDDTFFPHR